MHILADAGIRPGFANITTSTGTCFRTSPWIWWCRRLLGSCRSKPAGKVFIALTFALLAGGTMALHAALHRRWSPWPLLAVFFLYNSVFLWGFLNYLFGLGLALFACALWVRLRTRSALLVVPFFSLSPSCCSSPTCSHSASSPWWSSTYELAQWWNHRRETARTLATPPAGKRSGHHAGTAPLDLAPTFKGTPDDYPLWLRGSSPPPLVTCRFSRNKTRIPERDHPNGAPAAGSRHRTHADWARRDRAGPATLVRPAVDVPPARRNRAGRHGDA